MENRNEIINIITDWGLHIEIIEDDDILVEEQKLVIRYCNFKNYCDEIDGKNRRFHSNKRELYMSKGYMFILIFEDEYRLKKDVVISRLKNFLQINKGETIYGRKCLIKEIETKVSSAFCKRYHVQGNSGARVKLGAFKNKGLFSTELISVLTMGIPSRAKGNKIIAENSWELIRFCSDSRYRAVGTASKLLKYFERNYKWDYILTFADKRWSRDGNMYKKLGFELCNETQPNYYYLNYNQLLNKDEIPHKIHRFAFRRDALREKAKKESDIKPEIIDTMSEYDLSLSLGYRRIFDCGHFKFEKYNKIT